MGYISHSSDEVALEEVLGLLKAVLEPDMYLAIEKSLVAVVIRMLEIHLLRDKKLRSIARFRDVYAGRAREMIADRVRELGLSAHVDAVDIEHLRQALLEGAVPASRGAPVAPDTEYALFRKLRLDGLEELRCRMCGYHFRREDLSPTRVELSEQFGLTLASRRRVERLDDHLKNPEETECQIDHIVPRAGWGSTRSDNLQLLCKYCNQGKSIFRKWGELLPNTTAASLPSIMGDSLHWQLRGSFVGALMRDESTCRSCGNDWRRTELTVRRADAWISLLTLKTTCYECAPVAEDWVRS